MATQKDAVGSQVSNKPHTHTLSLTPLHKKRGPKTIITICLSYLLIFTTLFSGLPPTAFAPDKSVLDTLSQEQRDKARSEVEATLDRIFAQGRAMVTAHEVLPTIAPEEVDRFFVLGWEFEESRSDWLNWLMRRNQKPGQELPDGFVSGNRLPNGRMQYVRDLAQPYLTNRRPLPTTYKDLRFSLDSNGFLTIQHPNDDFDGSAMMRYRKQRFLALAHEQVVHIPTGNLKKALDHVGADVHFSDPTQDGRYIYLIPAINPPWVTRVLGANHKPNRIYGVVVLDKEVAGFAYGNDPAYMRWEWLPPNIEVYRPEEEGAKQKIDFSVNSTNPLHTTLVFGKGKTSIEVPFSTSQLRTNDLVHKLELFAISFASMANTGSVDKTLVAEARTLLDLCNRISKIQVEMQSSPEASRLTDDSQKDLRHLQMSLERFLLADTRVELPAHRSPSGEEDLLLVKNRLRPVGMVVAGNVFSGEIASLREQLDQGLSSIARLYADVPIAQGVAQTVVDPQAPKALLAAPAGSAPPETPPGPETKDPMVAVADSSGNTAADSEARSSTRVNWTRVKSVVREITFHTTGIVASLAAIAAVGAFIKFQVWDFFQERWHPYGQVEIEGQFVRGITSDGKPIYEGAGRILQHPGAWESSFGHLQFWFEMAQLSLVFTGIVVGLLVLTNVGRGVNPRGSYPRAFRGWGPLRYISGAGIANLGQWIFDGGTAPLKRIFTAVLLEPKRAITSWHGIRPKAVRRTDVGFLLPQSQESTTLREAEMVLIDEEIDRLTTQKIQTGSLSQSDHDRLIHLVIAKKRHLKAEANEISTVLETERTALATFRILWSLLKDRYPNLAPEDYIGILHAYRTELYKSATVQNHPALNLTSSEIDKTARVVQWLHGQDVLDAVGFGDDPLATAAHADIERITKDVERAKKISDKSKSFWKSCSEVFAPRHDSNYRSSGHNARGGLVEVFSDIFVSEVAEFLPRVSLLAIAGTGALFSKVIADNTGNGLAPDVLQEIFFQLFFGLSMHMGLANELSNNVKLQNKLPGNFLRRLGWVVLTHTHLFHSEGRGHYMRALKLYFQVLTLRIFMRGLGDLTAYLSTGGLPNSDFWLFYFFIIGPILTFQTLTTYKLFRKAMDRSLSPWENLAIGLIYGVISGTTYIIVKIQIAMARDENGVLKLVGGDRMIDNALKYLSNFMGSATFAEALLFGGGVFALLNIMWAFLQTDMAKKAIANTIATATTMKTRYEKWKNPPPLPPTPGCI